MKTKKNNAFDSTDASRGFSESKKDHKSKMLVTYDIYENKKYSFLLKLIEIMFFNNNKF